MNLRETKSMLEVLQAAFPSFYRGMGEDELLKIIKLWQAMFSDDPYSVVMAAVKALIATKIEGYPPTIGAVKEQIAKITHPEQLSEMDAWALVNKACQNGYYGFKDEFKKLPEVVQRAVGSAEQLIIWSQMDEGTVNSVVASNFMRTFNAKQQQQKENVMLPGDIKTLIASMTERMQIQAVEERGTAKTAMPGPKKLEAPTLTPLKKLISESGTPLKKFEPPNAERWEPPSDEEWAKKRDAALEMLAAIKK